MLWKKVINTVVEEFSGKEHKLYHRKQQKTLVLKNGEGHIIKQVQVDDVNPRFAIEWILNVAVLEEKKDYDIVTEGNDYLN